MNPYQATQCSSRRKDPTLLTPMQIMVAEYANLLGVVSFMYVGLKAAMHWQVWWLFPVGIAVGGAWMFAVIGYAMSVCPYAIESEDEGNER